jgi:hypothetical protein
MRTSHVVLVVAGVAAAAVTGSAFTNSNDVSGVTDPIAGYGSVSVSGVTVTHVSYNPLSGFADQVDDIVFTIDTPNSGALDATHQQAKLTLKDTSDTQIGSYACTFGADNAGSQDLTCSTGSPDSGGAANPLFIDVKTVGLTVSDKS